MIDNQSFKGIISKKREFLVNHLILLKNQELFWILMKNQIF